MPRFVLLKHECPPGHPRPTHWDFMLESGQTLRTWALAAPPQHGLAIDAERLADHRPAYLEYEGPVSGDRGTVTRCDRGEYAIERDDHREIDVRLFGDSFIGQATLRALDDGDQRWRFVFSSSSSATTGGMGSTVESPSDSLRCDVRPAT